MRTGGRVSYVVNEAFSRPIMSRSSSWLRCVSLCEVVVVVVVNTTRSSSSSVFTFLTDRHFHRLPLPHQGQGVPVRALVRPCVALVPHHEEVLLREHLVEDLLVELREVLVAVVRLATWPLREVPVALPCHSEAVLCHLQEAGPIDVTAS